jgi:hypothetical protein
MKNDIIHLLAKFEKSHLPSSYPIQVYGAVDGKIYVIHSTIAKSNRIKGRWIISEVPALKYDFEKKIIYDVAIDRMAVFTKDFITVDNIKEVISSNKVKSFYTAEILLKQYLVPPPKVTKQPKKDPPPSLF